MMKLYTLRENTAIVVYMFPDMPSPHLHFPVPLVQVHPDHFQYGFDTSVRLLANVELTVNGEVFVYSVRYTHTIAKAPSMRLLSSLLRQEEIASRDVNKAVMYFSRK